VRAHSPGGMEQWSDKAMTVSRTELSRNELHDAKPLTVTVATAKKLSGLGNTTIWGLIKEHRLEVVHVGRRALITYRSLEALLGAARPTSEPLHGHRGRPRRNLPDSAAP
jgi:hypothetical protein